MPTMPLSENTLRVRLNLQKELEAFIYWQHIPDEHEHDAGRAGEQDK